MNVKRKIYSILLIVIIGILGACGSTAPPVPRDHYYRLAITSPTDSLAKNALRGTVIVEPLLAEGLLRERPLLFGDIAKPNELQQHDYHYWIEDPAHLMQDQLINYLRRGEVAEFVVTPEMRVAANFRLSGKTKRLERVIGGGQVKVFVELELALVDLVQNRIVTVDSYREDANAENGEVTSSVAAINEATARIFARFLNDVMEKR